MINRKFFYDYLRKALFSGSLTQPQVDGCSLIIDEWEKRELTNINQLAYILATVYHETGFTMESIRERGSDGYFHGRYDIEGNHPKIARALGNDQPGDGVKYHGRGFVMITGKHNYRKFGKRYDINLLNNPDLALDPNIAVDILFDGMLEGLFTGKRLDKYLNSQKSDYFNVRRVVNGRDRAQKIASYAHHFENALTQSTELVIKNVHNEAITVDVCTLTRVLLVNCQGLKVDLSQVTFTEKAEDNVHLVEIRG